MLSSSSTLFLFLLISGVPTQISGRSITTTLLQQEEELSRLTPGNLLQKEEESHSTPENLLEKEEESHLTPGNFLQQEEEESSHLTPENEVVSHLLQEDDEIAEEKNEISSPGGGGTKIKKFGHNSVLRLPAYLNQDDEFGGVGVLKKREEGENGGHEGGDNEPLARVWLPVEIRGGSEIPPGLSIIFQQTQPLGNFVRAEIVLTTRPRNDLPRRPKSMRMDVSVKALTNKKQDFDGINNETKNDTSFSEISAVRKSNKFYVLDVTEAFKTALSSSEEKLLQHPHKFEVQLEGLGVNFDLFDVQVERPFVIFSYGHDFDVTNEFKRKKRSISSSSGETNNSIPTMEPRVPNHLCHREEWSVDTHADIEWYDMVQPKRLELGFCTGDCPFPLQNDHFNYTLHTFFKDRHRLHKIFDIPKNFPKTCCVPVSYRPVKAWIEEEESTIVYRVFPDVAVDQCGCR